MEDEPEPLTASDFFHRGVELLQRGEFELALECINGAISRNYFGADIAMVKGEVLFELGRFQDALEWFDRAVQLDSSGQTEATLWRGRIFFEMGQFGRALSALNRVIASSAAPADAYFTKGMVLVERGDGLKALDALAEAKALVGDSNDKLADILYWEGKALRSLRRDEEAVAALERVLWLESDYIEAYSELGELFRAQGRLDQACEVYRRGLREYPDDPELCTALGNALRDVGRLAESLEWHNKAVEAMANDPSVTRYNRAVTFERLGQWDDALEDYGAVLEHNPEDIEIHIRRLDIYSRLDRFTEAYAEWDRVPEAHRKSVEAEDKYARLLNRHARALESEGKQLEALRLVRKLMGLHPDLVDFDNPGKQFASAEERHQRVLAQLASVPRDDAEAELVPLVRANINLRLGNSDAVRADLPLALEGPCPEMAEVLAAKWLLREAADLEGAMAAVDRALGKRKDYIEALWTKVEIQRHGLRDSHGAVETYVQMLKLQPGNPTVLHDLGTLYLEEGEPLRALVCFRSLQDQSPGDMELQVEVATCYIELGRIGEAVSELRRLVQQVESDLDVRFLLIEALLLAGEETEASDMLAEVEQLNGGLDPSVTDTCGELRAVLLNRIGRHQQALELLGRIEEEELTATGMLQLGVARSRIGQLDAASSVFERLMSEVPRTSRQGLRARLELAKVRRASGNLPAALDLAREAASLDPYSRVAQALYTWILRENGLADEADAWETLAGLFRETEPGLRLLLTEQYQDAVTELREVVGRYPEFPDAQYLYAAALCRTGQFTAATDALRRAIRHEPAKLELAKRDPWFDGFAFSELAE